MHTTRRRINSLWPYAIVILIYAFFRLTELDRSVHIDEPHWLGRSMNFFRALASGEFEHTYQREHPGVMTMWAGAIAWFVRFPEVSALLDENVANPYLVSRRLWSWGQDPMQMMVAARVSKVLLQTCFFVLSLAFLRRLIGKVPTVVTGALLAASPIMIGWDSWLHIDGMSAITSFAGLTATAYAAERTSLVNPLNKKTALLWILAGAISSTAWLTRITALSLVGGAGLALLLQLIVQARTRQPGQISGFSLFINAFRYGICWAIGGVIGSFLLFPALWITPVEVIKEVVGLPIAGLLGRGDPAFFPEGVHPGRGVSYLLREVRFRMTPFEWIGIVSFVVLGYIAWRVKAISGVWVRLFIITGSLTVVTILGLAASPKTYTRYLMMVYPLITLMAGLGLVASMRLLKTWKPTIHKAVPATILSIAIVYSLIASAALLPYKGMYKNPVESAITGRGAGSVLLPGQDQVANFILESIEDRPVTIYPGSIRYALEYFISTAGSGVYFRNDDINSPQGWYHTDFFLAVARSSPEILSSFDPVEEIFIDGRAVYEIYDLTSVAPPSDLLSPNACHHTFGESATLLQIVDSEDRIDLYFLSRDGEPFSVELLLYHGEGEGQILEGETDSVPAGWITRIRLSKPEEIISEESQPLVVDLQAKSSSGTQLPVPNRRDGSSMASVRVPIDCYSSPSNNPLSPTRASLWPTRNFLA